MLSSEDSRVQIKDQEIVKFLSKQERKITLITMDTELADYCRARSIFYASEYKIL